MRRDFDWTDAVEASRVADLLAGYHKYLAHDLANQFVAIQGFARLLLEQAADPEQAFLMGRIADLTRKADQQARRFAEWGRLLREPVTLTPTDLASLIAEAVAEVKAAPRATQASGVAFDVVQQMRVVPVPRSLRRVLTELLHNAVAAGPSRVEVRADGSSLTIRDDGSGIAEPALRKLGTLEAGGLGWYFVAQAVAGWRGRLTVASEPGRGTAVTILLPQSEA